MLQQADRMGGDMHFGNEPTICTLGTEQNLSGSRKKKMKRTRRRGLLSDRNEGLFFLFSLYLSNT